MPSHYPLSKVRELLNDGFVELWPDVLSEAQADFGSTFSTDDIIKCLLLLNDKPHKLNPEKNHFFKKEKHRFDATAMMDYYKAKNIAVGINLYTHFYIDAEYNQLVICSFKEL
jgi:hypothetical protein